MDPFERLRDMKCEDSRGEKSARNGEWAELARDLPAEATDQTGRFTPDPFVGLTHGLTIPEYFLGIPSIQVDQAVSCEYSGKTD